MKLCREMWKHGFEEHRSEWAPRLLHTYEWMLAECAAAWQESKAGRITRVVNPDGTQLLRQEPPDPRWLSGMLAVGKELSTLIGVRQGVDSVSRVEIPETTRQALAPMSTDDYLAMLATTGGLSGVTAVPPTYERPAELEAVAVDAVVTEAHPSDRGGLGGRVVRLD
jgi:hypothetical protein